MFLRDVDVPTQGSTLKNKPVFVYSLTVSYNVF